MPHVPRQIPQIEGDGWGVGGGGILHNDSDYEQWKPYLTYEPEPSAFAWPAIVIGLLNWPRIFPLGRLVIGYFSM